MSWIFGPTLSQLAAKRLRRESWEHSSSLQPQDHIDIFTRRHFRFQDAQSVSSQFGSEDRVGLNVVKKHIPCFHSDVPVVVYEFESGSSDNAFRP